MEDAFKVLEEIKLEGTGPNARTYVIMVRMFVSSNNRIGSSGLKLLSYSEKKKRELDMAIKIGFR